MNRFVYVNIPLRFSIARITGDELSSQVIVEQYN